MSDNQTKRLRQEWPGGDIQDRTTDEATRMRARGGGRADELCPLADIPRATDEGALYDHQAPSPKGSCCSISRHKSAECRVLPQATAQALEVQRPRHPIPLLGSGGTPGGPPSTLVQGKHSRFRNKLIETFFRSFAGESENGSWISSASNSSRSIPSGTLPAPRPWTNLRQVPRGTRQVQKLVDDAASFTANENWVTPMSDIMGTRGHRQEHLGQDQGVAESAGDLLQVSSDEMVGWLEPPSSPMSDSGRSDVTDPFPNGSDEASFGCAQPGVSSGSERGNNVVQPPESDPHLKFRPTNLVRDGWETGQWVAETYRRWTRKSGACATCLRPYVFCDGSCPGNYDDDMEGALAFFGDPRNWREYDWADIHAIKRELDDIADRRFLECLKDKYPPMFNVRVKIRHVEDSADWGWAKNLTIFNVANAREL